MLDRELAVLYSVEARVLNQSVRRHSHALYYYEKGKAIRGNALTTSAP